MNLKLLCTPFLVAILATQAIASGKEEGEKQPPESVGQAIEPMELTRFVPLEDLGDVELEEGEALVLLVSDGRRISLGDLGGDEAIEGLTYLFQPAMQDPEHDKAIRAAFEQERLTDDDDFQELFPDLWQRLQERREDPDE